jgi:LemA protein
MKKFAFGCGGVLLVIVFLAVVLTIMGLGKYNALVKLDQNVNQQWAQVQNVYQRRADLVPNLVNTVQGAANFEKTTLIAVTEARASVGRLQINQSQAPATAQQLEQFQAAQGELGNALSRLLVVAERYPDLKANANFQQLQAQLEGTENRIAVERGNFNQAVRDYNTAVRSFPTLIFAGMMGFHTKPFFNAQPGAERAPQVNFNFGNNTPAPAAPAAATP